MASYDGYINIDTRISTTEFKTGIARMQMTVQNGAKIMVAALATVTAAVAGIGIAAIKVGSNFESAMSKVSAISGATGDDLAALTKKAEEMGATTKFSATESAEALQYMAMAGWDTEAMLGGIEGIMNLAAADGLDLATTSDIVTDALTAFGLSAKDSGHFADVLAKASSSANTNVSMLGESFKYAAPLAGTMGYSIEDMALALGLMANSGIKGSQAGTSLKDALANLARPTKKMENAINDLGLSITDTNGDIKPLRTLLSEMRESFGDLSTAEQTAAASTIFGKEAMSGMLAIINASDEDFNKLAGAIDNADGTAKSMAETMQNNLQGQITILKSSLEGLGIQIYDEIKYPLTETAKDAIESISKISSAFADEGISGAAAAVGEIFANALSGIAESASHIGDYALEFIDGFCSGISNNIGRISAASKEIVQSLIDGVIQQLPTMVDSASDMIGIAAVCIDRFIDGITQNAHRIGNAAKDVVKALAEGVVTILPKELQEPISEVMKSIEKSFNSGGLKKALETFKTAIKKAGTSAKDIASKYLVPLVNAVDKLAEHIDIIIPLIVSWKAALAAMSIVKTAAAAISAVTTATTAESIATAASTGALTLKQIAVAVLTDEITLATAAQYAYNMAIESNPIGAIITVIAALAAGYAALTLLTDDQTEAEKEAEQSEERLQQRMQDYNDQLEIYSNTLGEIGEKTAEFQEGIDSAGSCLEGLNDSVVMSAEKQQELTAQMDEVQTEITEIARRAADERRNLTQSEIDRLNELFAKEKELAEQQLKVKQDYQNVVKEMAEDLVANEQITVEEYEAYAQQYINTAQTTRDEAIQVAEDYRINYLAEKRALIGSDTEHTQEWYDNERAEANKHYQESVDTANKTCADTLQILSDGYLDKSEVLDEYVNKMSGYNDREHEIEKEHVDNQVRLQQQYYDDLEKLQEEHANDYSSNTEIYNKKVEELNNKYAQKMADEEESYMTKRTNLITDMNATTCDQVVQDNLSAWIAMQTNTELYGGKLTSKGKVILDDFLDSFKYLDDEMRQQSNQAMDGMLQGLEDREPALYAKADSIANNIISKLKSAFEIHSPSRVTRKIFTQVIQGGEVGIENEAPKLYKSAENTASIFADRMTSSLSSADLVARMQGAVYSNNRSIANVASARVEHIISTQNSVAYQQPTGLKAQGTIENHIHIDGREAAIVLTPYISEELAFS